MNKPNYRINLFNNNYIVIYSSSITYKHNEYLNNNTDENAMVWHNLFKAINEANIILSNSPIVISKNTIEAQIIIKELHEEEKDITIEDIKNACVIATYENNIEYMNKLSKIIIHYNESTPKNAKEFSKKYGTEITNFVLNNNNIKEYRKRNNGLLPYEHERTVYLYEDGKIQKVELPIPTKIAPKTKIKIK